LKKFVSFPKTNPRILFEMENPTNSCVCVSAFQYVRGSIGVCLVCLAHQLAVVVVAVKKKKGETP
jgi:hypothetical protein